MYLYRFCVRSWTHVSCEPRGSIKSYLRYLSNCLRERERERYTPSKSACSRLQHLWKICTAFGLMLKTWCSNIVVSSHTPQLVCVCEAGATAARHDQLSWADGIICGLFFLHTTRSLVFLVQPPSTPDLHHDQPVGAAVLPSPPSIRVHVNFTLILPLYFHIPFLFPWSQPLWCIFFVFPCIDMACNCLCVSPLGNTYD